MSDPMTNMEIEDVLSSIRRLVSEDHRLPPRVAVKVELPADKLVLTPALRIVPESRPTLPAPEIAVPEPSVESAPSHEAAAAVMEAALSTSAEDWEPDGSEAPAIDWTVEWEVGPASETAKVATVEFSSVRSDVPVTESEQEPEAQAEPLLDDELDPLADLDEGLAEPLVDEEMIRDIVRQVLREELQGTLGERITRNVRKLVRAEINRALAARDLE